MKIKVKANDGGSVDLIKTHRGVAVHSRDENNTITRVDTVNAEEVLMARDLLRYMRDNGLKSVYLLEKEPVFFEDPVYKEFRVLE